MSELILTDESVCQLPSDVQTRPENDGVTLIYGGNRAPYLVNETAAEILALLRAPRTVRTVVAEMRARYPTASEGLLRADVLGLLARLIKERYVVATQENLVNDRSA